MLHVTNVIVLTFWRPDNFEENVLLTLLEEPCQNISQNVPCSLGSLHSSKRVLTWVMMIHHMNVWFSNGSAAFWIISRWTTTYVTCGLFISKLFWMCYNNYINMDVLYIFPSWSLYKSKGRTTKKGKYELNINTSVVQCKQGCYTKIF